MLFRKRSGDRYRIMTGHGHSPPRRRSPRGAWLWIVLRLCKRKIQPLIGVKEACPLGLLPPLGERGGHHRNFHASSKNSGRDFYRADSFNFCGKWGLKQPDTEIRKASMPCQSLYFDNNNFHLSGDFIIRRKLWH
jgi:hypothetical protein